jgi:hypothetical protein
VRFIHDFGDGLRLELVITDKPPANKESHIVALHWYGGKPGKKHFEQYLRFAKEVNQTGADRWEFWGFEANREPVLQGASE